jgi:hypothetical protein
MSESAIPAILLAALIQVESSGNPRAYNRAEDAAGVLQIRRIFVDDLNRIYGPPYYTFGKVKGDGAEIPQTLWDYETTRAEADE